MYRNLEAELKRNGIKREQIANALSINIATVSAKLTRSDRLRLDEAVKIQQTFFPELDLKYLFECQAYKTA
jgi:orotate phosphoribosyltransferase-like protein